jgi:hypothetical protein
MKTLIRCEQLLLKYLYIVTLYSYFIVPLSKVFIKVTILDCLNSGLKEELNRSIFNYFGYVEKYGQI